MLVYVIGASGKPLMPSKRGNRVRWLLKSKQAKIVKTKPFTIQLLYETPEIAQSLIGGTDPGRTNIGEAVVRETGEAVYAAQVETRNKKIPDLMKKRKGHRHVSRHGERRRRQRRAIAAGTVFQEADTRQKIIPGCDEPITLHYITNSKARFLYRTRPSGWLTPTATQLLRTHQNMVNKICNILPVTGWNLELNRFTFMRMENGTVYGPDFQNGTLKGFADVKDYINASQRGRCACCGAPIKHYHHIIPVSKGGSDGPENRIGLCEECHAKIHTREMKNFLSKAGKEKKYAALSVLNQIIPQLYEWLVSKFGEENVHVCMGYDTAQARTAAHLPKTHVNDALCIAAMYLDGNPYLGSVEPYQVKQFRRHDRAIINNQRERTYKLDGVVVAKNRAPRFEQEGPSLKDFLNSFPKEQQRAVCSKLTVKRSTRHYNDLKRVAMPGDVFIFEGSRYVLSGQHTYGTYYRAVGKENKNFPANQCRIIHNGGLVHL